MKHNENGRVVIVCYSYSDNFAYMEQKLSQAFKKLGYQVTVLCSTANRIDAKNVVHVNSGEYITEHGYTVCRLKFIMGGHLPEHKLPIVLSGVYAKLCDIKPDIIYHMGISVNLLDVKKYVKMNSDVKLFVDNHASYANSAHNFLSMVIQHKMLYRGIARSVMPYVKKFFYIAGAEKVFLEEVYRIPHNRMSLFALGDLCPDDAEYRAARVGIRKELDIDDKDIVLTISGKFTRQKATVEIIKAMKQITDKRPTFRVLIVGDVQDTSIEEEFIGLIESCDKRQVKHLGWKTSGELKRILCASDIYVQASGSSTFQTAVCCGCVGVAVDKEKTYSVYPEGLFTIVDSIKAMGEFVDDLVSHNSLAGIKTISFSMAKEELDYGAQITRELIEEYDDQG